MIDGARRFFQQDGRLLERHLFHVLFGHGPREAVSPGVELECRSIVTLNALKTLRAFGRL